MKYKTVLILFFILIASSQSLQIENGVLDLSKWNKIENPVVDLKGDWKFFWKKSVTHETKALHSIDLMVPVPSKWIDLNESIKEISSYGYATYILNVINAPEEELGIRLKYFRSAYSIYFDNELMLKKGIVSESAEKYKMKQGIEYIHFTPKKTDFSIYIQLANYDHYYSGITKPIKIGSRQALLELNKMNSLVDIFLAASLLAFGIFHFIVFLIRRKDHSTLYFSLFCMIGVLRTLILRERLIFTIFPEISSVLVDLLNIGSYYLGVAIFIQFIDKMFPKVYPKKLKKGFLWVTLLFTASCFSGSLWFSYKLEIAAHFIVLSYICSVCYYFYNSYKSKDQYVTPFFIGLLIVLIFFSHDVLVGMSIINGQMLFSIGMLFFFLFYTIIIARKNEAVFKENEILTMYLTDSNEGLEHKIEQRTAELSIALDIAESTAEAKSRFLSFMTHELRTPISAVIGYSELIEEEMLDSREENYLDDIRRIKTSGKHLLSVVNSVLDLSKAESGLMELKPEKIEIQDVVDQVKSTFLNSSNEIHNTFVVENNTTIEFLSNDRTKLNQILFNVVGNALKFTHKGDVKLLISNTKERVFFVTTDTGIGITDEQISRLFFEFQQADSDVTKNYGGTGLGLIISKLYIEQMSGTISVESEYGKGSVFSIDLPIKI